MKAFTGLLLCLLVGSAFGQEADVAFFESKIRPVLAENCYECHSASAAADGKLKGGLQLDTRAGMRKGGETGPSLVPGNSAESLVLSALNHESDLSLPIIREFVFFHEVSQHLLRRPPQLLRPRTHQTVIRPVEVMLADPVQHRQCLAGLDMNQRAGDHFGHRSRCLRRSLCQSPTRQSDDFVLFRFAGMVLGHLSRLNTLIGRLNQVARLIKTYGFKDFIGASVNRLALSAAR